MHKIFPVIAAIGALGGVAFTAAPAEAKIRCQGVFQVTKYGLHATPYCEEQRIAQVARQYGYDVRDSGLDKIKFCMAYGYDNRLREACAPYYPPRGR